ncbi:MAG: S46 family peptidase, partial [Chlorobi bacterium]|nr:S46 family peptidase [Chlorobiota bacterium]
YNYQLPYISSLYEWTIKLIEAKTEGNEEMSLAYSTRIKRLSNTMKNYKGKIQGLRNTQLITTKQKEEKEIQEFIKADKERNEKYDNLFSDIAKVYSKKDELAEANLWLSRLYSLSDNFKLAKFVIQYAEEREKDNSKRKTSFKDENIEKSIRKLDKIFKISMKEIEQELITKMICDAIKFSVTSRIKAVDNTFDETADRYDVMKFVEDNLISTEITKRKNFDELLNCHWKN